MGESQGCGVAAAAASDTPVPIAVIGAGHAEVIPVRHAQELCWSLSGRKKMWTITGAGHNDWFDCMDPSQWREIMESARGKNSE